MSSKKKYIILTLLVLMFPFFLIRILNNFKMKEFKQKLEIVSEDLKKDFLDQKSIILNETIKSKKVKDLFNEEYNENSSITSFDTVFTFFYITTPFSYKAHDKKYLFCLLERARSSTTNTFNSEKIELKKSQLNKKHGKGYKMWYPDFKSYLDGIDSVSCSQFLTYSTVNFDKSNWNDFSNFLAYYSKTIKEEKRKNSSEKNKFKNYKYKRKKQLKSKFHNNYETELKSKKDNFLIKSKKLFRYKSSLKGEIVFYFESITFNETKFDKVSENIFEDQWKTNTLFTGATPYKNCFGGNPSCYPPSGYEECSFIKVIAPFNSNVIVTVKKSGSVYKHAYIKLGSSYKFTLPNGKYQTFFYYGNGWNPNKKIKSSQCGYLKGGFVSDETISKSKLKPLYNSYLTYTLQRMRDGNFSPKSSTSTEAF